MDIFDKNFHFIHYDWFMEALFLQPTTYQTDDFLSCRLWERQDASFVRTAMTHINMQVLLVLGERQAINARSSPRIDIAININHLRIILGQELYRMIIECWRELHVFCPLWHHQFLQIALSCLDTEIFLEWFGIIAVITQLPSCLHIKRGCGIIIGE